MIHTTVYKGDEVLPYIQDVAHLRINVFKQFPYLYDGNMAYETDYLQTYCKSSGAIIVIAKDDNKVIGASSAIPLREETDNIKRPIINTGYNVDDIFYYGESVLLHPYRGQGIGVDFMQQRENHAKKMGYKRVVFCAVIRQDTHPLRPVSYVPLDGFWTNRGFKKWESVTCHIAWQDTNGSTETVKTLQFWYKDLF